MSLRLRRGWLIAQLLLAAREFDRAEALFSELNREAPDSADVSAGARSHRAAQRRCRGRPPRMETGHRFGHLPMRQALLSSYAILADEAGLSPEDIRPALERAVALDPHFDDAHYQLALLEKNADHYEAALRHFQAMRVIPAARAYAYWLALADTYNELGRRDEAQSASQHAAAARNYSIERARADEQTYIADTDIGVRFARDATGHLILITARMKHRETRLESVHRAK